MVWCDLVWYVVWHGMVRYGTPWHGVVWYGMAWLQDMIWHGIVRYGWWGLVRCGMVWHCVVWYSMVRCGFKHTWHGRYSTASVIARKALFTCVVYTKLCYTVCFAILCCCMARNAMVWFANCVMVRRRFRPPPVILKLIANSLLHLLCLDWSRCRRHRSCTEKRRSETDFPAGEIIVHAAATVTGHCLFFLSWIEYQNYFDMKKEYSFFLQQWKNVFMFSLI